MENREEYEKKVESACKDLLNTETNPVRAGQIAKIAGIENASKLGYLLTLEVLEFEDVEYEVIKHEAESVSNEYRLRQ